MNTATSRYLLPSLTFVALVAAVLSSASFAFASSTNSYDYDYRYNSYDYDNSYHNSYNNYGYNNSYAYGYDRDYYNSYDYSYYGGYYNNDNYGYGSMYKPSCSITIQNYSGSVGYDRSITLAWSSSYATSGYISGIGSVGTNGAQVVYYPYNSSYTLTVYGPGGSATCQTYNNNYATHLYNNDYYGGYSYNSNNYAYPLYSYPNYSAYTYPNTYSYPTYSVPLSQTPYTGFDFGPLGNSLYWFGMILVAMCGAYLLVYYHGGFSGRIFAREVAHAARNQIRTIRSILG